jgi:uncharacterized membrane protein
MTYLENLYETLSDTKRRSLIGNLVEVEFIIVYSSQAKPWKSTTTTFPITFPKNETIADTHGFTPLTIIRSPENTKGSCNKRSIIFLMGI